MTKIKNFRVTLRAREMARYLKKERGVETTPELELAIEQTVNDGKKWVAPAAVYTTLTRQTAEKTTPISFPPVAVALSVAAVTIGTALETERRASEPGSTREMLLAALEQEALTQALQFTVRLIGEQAKEEECEMSPPVSVQDGALVSSLSALLGVARIGIHVDASTETLPPHTRVSYWFWTPAGKGSSGRAQPVGRTEKVAA